MVIVLLYIALLLYLLHLHLHCFMQSVDQREGQSTINHNPHDPSLLHCHILTKVQTLHTTHTHDDNASILSLHCDRQQTCLTRFVMEIREGFLGQVFQIPPARRSACSGLLILMTMKLASYSHQSAHALHCDLTRDVLCLAVLCSIV